MRQSIGAGYAGPLWVINVISSAFWRLLLFTQLQTYRCVALNDVKGQSRHFALQQTASVPAMTSMRLSSERIRFHLPWRKPVSRFVLHDVPGKDSERTMIGGRKSADGFRGRSAPSRAASLSWLDLVGRCARERLAERTHARGRHYQPFTSIPMDTTAKIRELNDALRTAFAGRGRIFIRFVGHGAQSCLRLPRRLH